MSTDYELVIPWVLYDAHQAVDTPTQVGVPTGDVDMLNLRRVKHTTLPCAVPAAKAPGRSLGLLPRSRSDCAERARGLPQVPALLKQEAVRKE